MTEQNKTKRRQYTDAHRKATQKYMDSRGRIALTMTKEQKEQITQAATDAGQSVNQYILSRVLNN